MVFLKVLYEWDTEDEWEIRFNYIYRLWKLKKAALDLIYQNQDRKNILRED